MKTYLLRFETKPAIDSENLGRFAGAYWTAWVVSDSKENAMGRAMEYASKRGWQFERGKDIHIVERTSHSKDLELLSLSIPSKREFPKAIDAGITSIITARYGAAPRVRQCLCVLKRKSSSSGSTGAPSGHYFD